MDFDRCTHTDTTPDGRERRCVKPAIHAMYARKTGHLMGTIVTLLDRVGLDDKAEEA